MQSHGKLALKQSPSEALCSEIGGVFPDNIKHYVTAVFFCLFGQF